MIARSLLVLLVALLSGCNHDGSIYRSQTAGGGSSPVQTVVLSAPTAAPTSPPPIDFSLFAASAPAPCAIAGTTWHHRVGAQALTISLDADGRINGQNTQHWTCRDNILQLQWNDPGAPNGAWLDTCTLNAGESDYVCRNQSYFMTFGDRVGASGSPPAVGGDCSSLLSSSWTHMAPDGGAPARLQFLANGIAATDDTQLRYLCSGEDGFELVWRINGNTFIDDCALDASRTTYSCRNQLGHLLIGARRASAAAPANRVGQSPCEDIAGSSWRHRLVDQDGGIVSLDPDGRISGNSANRWSCVGNQLSLSWQSGAYLDGCVINGAGTAYSCRNQYDALVLGTRQFASVPTIPSSPVSVHDPATYVVKDALGADTVLLFGTGNGITVSRSSDARDWTTAGSGAVFPQMVYPLRQYFSWFLQLVPNFVGSIWAPDIARFNGVYHLYYAVSAPPLDPHQAIGLATSNSLSAEHPDAGWTDRGPVVYANQGGNLDAIDASLVFARGDENSPLSELELYLVFGSTWGVNAQGVFSGGANNIFIQAVEPSTGLLSNVAQRFLIGHLGDGMEGTFIVRHAGKFYLFAANRNCCSGVNSTYRMLVWRADGVTGPYYDRHGLGATTDGSGTPVFDRDHRLIGRGHGQYLKLKGREFLIAHFYDGADNGNFKFTKSELLWTTDGWPLAGPAE